MKKLVIVTLVLALVSGLVFAQGSQEAQSAKWTVGICQLVQHPALDAASILILMSDLIMTHLMLY